MFIQAHFEYSRPSLQEPKGEVDTGKSSRPPTPLTQAVPSNSMPARVVTKVRTMNTDKYKSVAVPIDVWEQVQNLARKNDRSVARQISWLIRKEHERTGNGKEGQAS